MKLSPSGRKKMRLASRILFEAAKLMEMYPNDKPSQKIIASKLKISQPFVSRILYLFMPKCLSPREKLKRNLARKRFTKYVRQGKIIRQPCEVCGKNPTDGHHPNYNRSLDVIWLCRTHHIQKHQELRKIE